MIFQSRQGPRWSGGRRLGVHFTEVDIESVEHLRNLITFNAQEPDIVWEEMQGGHLLRDV